MARKTTQPIEDTPLVSEGFIAMPLSERRPQEVLPEGKYFLRIEDAKLKEKDGKPWQVLVRHSVDGELDAKPVFHTIWLLSGEEEDHQRNRTLNATAAYMDAFQLEYGPGGFNFLDWLGATAEVNLSQRAIKDSDEVVNSIKLRY